MDVQAEAVAGDTVVEGVSGVRVDGRAAVEQVDVPADLVELAVVDRVPRDDGELQRHP
jgi:hypothetical protein